MGYASFVPEPAADWYVTPPTVVAESML